MMTTELVRHLCGPRQADHRCLFYDTIPERTAATVPFVKEGLTRRECCIVIADDHTSGELAAALAMTGVNVSRERQRGALLLLTNDETYLGTKTFDPAVTKEFLQQSTAQAVAAGFSGLRVTADMSWTVTAESGERLIECEALLNDFFSTNPVRAICQYNRRCFPPTLLHKVLRSHPLVVLGELVCPNLFYRPRALVLGRMSPLEHLDWKLDQLKQARAADQRMQENHALLQAVVEGTTDSVFVKDRQGRYLMINAAGARFLGRSVQEVLGKNDAELFSPQTAQDIQENDRIVMATGEPRTYEQVGTAAGVTRTYFSTKAPKRDAEGKVVGIIGIARDITASKTLQVERDQLLERLRLQINRLPLAYVMWDTNIRVIDWNPAAERIFGYTKEETVGRLAMDLIVPAAARDQVREVVRRIQAADMDAHSINENCTKDGRIITCEWLNTPLTDADGRFTGAISLAQDITQRKRAEEALREYAERLQALSRRVVEIQEEERRHLARELHDEIGQILTAVFYNLQAIKPACGPAALPSLEDTVAIVDRAIQQVRSLSLDLRPPILDELGLAAALNWYVEEQCRRSGLTAHVVALSVGTSLPPEIRNACFRVTQEALTNIVRHARARQVWLELRQDDGELQLRIRDDGIGFDLADVRQQAARGASFGVLSMQERVELLGGQIDIKSRAGQGTTIRVGFPLSSAWSNPRNAFKERGWEP